MIEPSFGSLLTASLMGSFRTAPPSARKLLGLRLMHVLFFLLSGLVIGVIARLLVPGREPGGWVTSLVFGVLGSFVGGFLGRLLGLYGEGRPAGFVMSVFGAIVLVFGYQAIVRRRASI